MVAAGGDSNCAVVNSNGGCPVFLHYQVVLRVTPLDTGDRCTNRKPASWPTSRDLIATLSQQLVQARNLGADAGQCVQIDDSDQAGTLQVQLAVVRERQFDGAC